ncbi:MAG: sensor histidine kinase [Saprospiraceae bacterium]|nr:sensor histidine kinase [Saprospiraceae bacterium]
MLKNLTPRQISVYISIVTSTIILLVFILIEFTLGNQGSGIWILRYGVTFLAAYFVTLYFIKNYIYRKIKLIYKNIHKVKLDPSQKNKSIDSDATIIEDVEKDVAAWAQDNEREISELKSLETYRREFLGNVSHELKTPIFNIQGYVHTLIDGGLDDEEVNVRYLRRCAKNVDRLITIVEDLETISKLESGKLLLDISAFDIKALVHEVFEAHELAASEKGVSLIYKDGASQGYLVNADTNYIRQVLDNLIINSIKYGKTGGTTKVAFYDMADHILVEVADNGIGMAEHHVKHVFDRFYRVDKSRSREVGGSGLGLAIVKHIIEAHNQTVNLRSAPDVGSTFGFTLSKA